MRRLMFLTVPVLVACSSDPDPAQICTDAKTAATAAWGDAHTAALAFQEGPEATADKEANSAAQSEAKKAETGDAVASHAARGRGGSVARSVTRGDASAKSGVAKAAYAKVARYGKLVKVTQAARDSSLGDAQAAWDATVSARKVMEGFWAPPESPPAAYGTAVTAGEASWAACANVPAAE
jgi:hypothetical protein